MLDWQRCIRQSVGLVGTLLLLITSTQRASGHGQPVQLAFWGGYAPGVARCQRAVSRAAAECSLRATEARQLCLDARLAGDTCDEEALTAQISAIRSNALDIVQGECSENEVRSLIYIDMSDAFKDVIDVCRRLDEAATSAVYGPAMVGGAVAAVGDTKRECLAATGHHSAKLMRFAMRQRQRALDRIASAQLDPQLKQAMVERSRQRIARARDKIKRRIDGVCPEEAFINIYGRDLTTFLDNIAKTADCLSEYVYIQDTVVCPVPECGNGVEEPEEECDDGNDFDGDGCRADCVETECEVFPNSYDLIQRAIFENRGCTNDTCHGAAVSGGLDLREGVSYENLVDVPSTLDPRRKRVEPGDPQFSVLYLKLAAATNPDAYPAEELGIGTPMPSGLPPLTSDELEAMRLWIYGAASRTGSFPNIGSLLNACLPEPEPLEIKPLEPLPAGEGVQLHMPPWIVDAHSEHEVCFATYYDVADQVPEAMEGPNDTFCYNVNQLRQDPLSHHLIVNRYLGTLAPDDPKWGPFTCRGGPREGEPCAPLDVGACGAGGECATEPIIGVGCNGVPPDEGGQSAAPFAGAQETNATQTFPEGVYRCIPKRGMILWNSHAFNLTNLDGTLEAWLNFRFAPPEERQYFAGAIFDLSDIFKMSVPAFGSQEVCNVHVLPQNAHLFELTSHTHQRGKRFRTFRGAYTCEMKTGGRDACDPLDPDECAGPCADPLATGAPEDALLYTNFTYNDPLQLTLDPPIKFSGVTGLRSLTYCSLYDNGFTDPATVKRQSTSPITPFGSSTCRTPTHCVSGQPKAPCSGTSKAERDASCDSMPGKGDGLCDACTLNGGVTTEDEMFILIGSWFVKND